MNEQNKKAYHDIINKNNKIINYNIDKETCYETCPCCHDITITLDDGRTVSLCITEKFACEYIHNDIKFH